MDKREIVATLLRMSDTLDDEGLFEMADVVTSVGRRVAQGITPDEIISPEEARDRLKHLEPQQSQQTEPAYVKPEQMRQVDREKAAEIIYDRAYDFWDNFQKTRPEDAKKILNHNKIHPYEEWEFEFEPTDTPAEFAYARFEKTGRIDHLDEIFQRIYDHLLAGGKMESFKPPSEYGGYEGPIVVNQAGSLPDANIS